MFLLIICLFFRILALILGLNFFEFFLVMVVISLSNILEGFSDHDKLKKEVNDSETVSSREFIDYLFKKADYYYNLGESGISYLPYEFRDIIKFASKSYYAIHDEIKKRHEIIRKVENKFKRPICILADLQGPKLRCGDFKDKQAELVAGQTFVFDNERLYNEKYGDKLEAAHHAVIRDEECCYLSSSLAVGLAKRFGSNLHVLHLSTAREMELFTTDPIENKHITAEGCVHHLTFSDKDYEELGNFIVCNPSIKTEEDRLGIIEAVKANKIDIIITYNN